MIMEDRFPKRLRKKARKGMRRWPVATIAYYGPNLSQATKVAVGIVPFENAEVAEMIGKWIVVTSGPTLVSHGRFWNSRKSTAHYRS
jgi:hypothetical protein